MTRMWLGVDPSDLCRDHLLGEWNELHKIAGSLRGNPESAIAQGGYLNVDTDEFERRARELYREMIDRGFDPDDALLSYSPPPGIGAHSPDINRRALSQRCESCNVDV